MNKNFDEIEQQIIIEFEAFLKKKNEHPVIGDGALTRSLKESIGQLGIKLNNQVATSGFPDIFESEWLYDLVWYQEDNERRLIRVPLIVESEWSRNYQQIKFDFEKLLMGNADRRLMICQWSKNDIETLLEKFKNAIDVFQENEHDRFLFAILDTETENEFCYWTYTKTNR